MTRLILCLTIALTACKPKTNDGAPLHSSTSISSPSSSSSPATPRTYRVAPAFPNLNFIRPVDLQNCGDRRLFVVEQAGRIRTFTNEPFTAISRVFLDLSGRVNDSGSEEGLLGLAFHPDFKSNGYFYVNYTAANPRRTVISRFHVSPADSNSADPESEFILLEYRQPFSNHNGGQLAFGPDGYLYIAVGDGGSGGDPHGNGQNLTTLLGKILRIDVDHTDAGSHYAIPADNPFAGTQHRGEIWAFGLRNPWRFSFDPLTHTLWAADVGQDTWEEIDVIEKGKNYGWNVMEGNHCYGKEFCDTTGLVFPVWEYGHTIGQSITGGYVYRGSAIPELLGAYIYADFMTGRIWALRTDPGIRNTEILRSGLFIASFGIDSANELYMCAFDGKIYKLEMGEL